MNNSLQETQQKIHNFIKAHPGVYRSKIAEILNLKLSDLEHHLNQLEKNGQIKSLTTGGVKQYYHKDYDSEILLSEDKTKKRIYNLIAQRPGLYMRKIADLLKMSTQLADYHLSQMEKDKEIISLKTVGQNKRYYITESRINLEEKRILELLAKKIPLEIVTLLLKYETLKHKELIEHLKLSPSRLSYHLSKLLEQGLIQVQPYGKEKGFTLANKTELIQILKKFRIQVELGIAIENFTGIWNDLHFDEK